MVELQQVRQMPAARPGTIMDEREDKNDFVDDRLSSGAFGCLLIFVNAHRKGSASARISVSISPRRYF
jgi:hypothetical protein